MATTVELELREVVVSTVVDELTKGIDRLDVRRGIDGLEVRNPPTIHRIPIDIRKGNESAYTPNFVSIGPYHRNVHQGFEDFVPQGLSAHLGSYLHEQTKGMKILYLKNFLDRTGKDVKHYASVIELYEEEARDRYHDRCNGLRSEEFVQMMVLDGCFIVEFLLKLCEGILELWFKSKKYNWVNLRNDLILMENQIPFFILKLIFDNSGVDVHEVEGGVPRRFEILDLCLRYVHYLGQGKITKEMLEQTHGEDVIKNVYHLLHLSYLCHMVEIIPEMESPPETLQDHIIEKTNRVFYFIAYVFLFPIKCFLLLLFYALIFLLQFIKLASKIMRQNPDMHNRQKVKAKEEEKKPEMIPTATELNEFGVTFKRKKDAKNSIDVSFEDRIMEIPVVLIQDSSSLIFRNYLALEQNCPEVGNKFTSYAVFMDDLIDTASDVALLKKRKIIVTLLGCDEEVAKLFNGLTVGLVFDSNDHYLAKLFVDARVHCNKKRNKWRAMLLRDYFSSPWSIISLFGAFTLLAFSATQVAYAIKKKS